METLEIDSCTLITDRGILKLMKQLPHLKEIDIYDCMNVTQRIDFMPPNLRVKYFNKDEENDRMIQLNPNDRSKTCTIL